MTGPDGDGVARLPEAIVDLHARAHALVTLVVADDIAGADELARSERDPHALTLAMALELAAALGMLAEASDTTVDEVWRMSALTWQTMARGLPSPVAPPPRPIGRTLPPLDPPPHEPRPSEHHPGLCTGCGRWLPDAAAVRREPADRTCPGLDGMH